MTCADPSERPLIGDIVTEFSRIRKDLSEPKLGSPLVSKH